MESNEANGSRLGDEIAAAEADLKAAQEALAAAKARLAELEGTGDASCAVPGADSPEGGESGREKEAAAEGPTPPPAPQSCYTPPQYGASPFPAGQPPQGGAAFGYGQQAPFGGFAAAPPQPGYGYQQCQQPYAQPCAQPYAPPSQPVVAKDHVAAGLLAIFLGFFGVHKFYLGYNTAGFIMLAVTIVGGILTLTLASWVVWLIAVIEGVVYLTKSQSDFERIYVSGKHDWF